MEENDLKIIDHFIIESNAGFYIISSSPTHRKAPIIRVIEIDQTVGSLHYCGILGLDTFYSLPQAFDYLESVRRIQLVKRIAVHAILGHITFHEGISFLLVSTKVRQDATLPGGDVVYTVIEWQWLRVSGVGVTINSKDAPMLEMLTKYPFSGTHYYSLTYDLTHAYPAPPFHCTIPTESATYAEFCWNAWLRVPFDNIGLGSHCAVLLQGMALSTPIGDTPNGNLCMLMRRSCLNPGTRFYTTGMNEQGEAGNETEMELILWNGDQTKFSWTSYVWRRGMVPLWWRIMPKPNSPKTGGEGEMIVRDRPYEGCASYYSRALQMYGTSGQFVHIHLLRAYPHDAQEAALTEFLEESLIHVAMVVPFHINIVHYDWLTNFKLVGSDRAIEGLWARSKDSLRNVGFSYGIQIGPILNTMHRQSGISRFTCADSLERTHTATFFMMLPVVAEMCKQLGLLLSTRTTEEYQRNGGGNTHSDSPIPVPQWGYFDRTLDVVSKSLKRIGVLDKLTNCFIYSGDVASILFTNGPAMHTNLMREYAANTSSPAPFSSSTTYPISSIVHGPPPQATLLTLQRSYQAANSEAERNSQYNIFLGKDVQPNHVQALYGSSIAKITQAGCMEIFVILERPAVVQDISISLPNLGDTSWLRMHVSIGTYSDSCRVVLQGLTVPCGVGAQQLLYSLPASPWDTFNSILPTSHQGRIVRVVFSPAPIEIPQVKLFGTWVGETQRTKPSVNTKTSCQRDNLASATQTAVEFIVKELELEKSKPDAISPIINSKETSKLPSFVDKYRELVLSQPTPITFTTSLKLEGARIQSGLSSEQRDSVLSEILMAKDSNLALDNFNPDFFVLHRDEKTESQIRRTSRAKQNASSNPNGCASQGCTNSLGFIRKRQCAYCKNRFCSDCIAPEQWKIVEYCWENNPHSVCKVCSSEIRLQLQLLQLVGSSTASSEARHNKEGVWGALLSSLCTSSMITSKHTTHVFGEYPKAAIYSSVPTAASSPPVESIIFPVGIVPLTTYWHAPVGTESVKIVIVLECSVCVETLSLLVDAIGYTNQDAPFIDVYFGKTLDRVTQTLYDTQLVGTWKVGECEPRSYLSFALETPVVCSVLELWCRLPPSSIVSNRVLHLGRIQVHGTHSTTPPALSGARSSSLHIPKSIPAHTNRPSKRILEIALDKDSPQPSGFSLEVHHGDAGISNQVRLLRITAATTNHKAEIISFHLINRYIVPKTSTNAVLNFGFPSPLPHVNIITFEFIASHGGEMFDVAPCPVQLIV